MNDPSIFLTSALYADKPGAEYPGISAPFIVLYVYTIKPVSVYINHHGLLLSFSGWRNMPIN